MRDRILEFARLLRDNGLRVSTAELLDALRAIELVGVADPLSLREALRATCVKRAADEEPFAELYDLFFFRRGAFLGDESGAEGREAAPLVEALRARGLSEEELEHLLAILADEAARMTPLARLGMGLRRTPLEALIRLAGLKMKFDRLQNPLQIGFFTQQLLEQMGFRTAVEELGGLEKRLGRAVGEERAKEVVAAARQHLEGLRGKVRGYVKDEFDRRHVLWLEEMRRDILANKPFGTLSEEDLRKLRREVERLAKKLKQQASLRPRVGRRGRLDTPKTIRRALGSGGVPFRLVHKRRRIDKPRLVVLCDISDSVRHVSRFMLQFAYSLQEMFAQVRSYVFVSDLAECTDLFRRYALHEAVDLAYAGGVVNVYANSNFGRSFKTFVERHLDAVTPRTTVIVIGDGRNNYNPPEAWALADIKQRARRLLWLNPEPPPSWAFGDSAMREYEPHCDRVESVNNLATLARVVDGLVL